MRKDKTTTKQLTGVMYSYSKQLIYARTNYIDDGSPILGSYHVGFQITQVQPVNLQAIMTLKI